MANKITSAPGRQFISDHEMTYHGCCSWVVNLVKIMLVRGMGIRGIRDIRDISAVLKISITTVVKVLKSGTYKIRPKKSHYDCLEIDEFWIYVGKKRTKYGLFMRITGKTGRL
jgi:hypothetical protein